jgi:hypothetical protein
MKRPLAALICAALAATALVMPAATAKPKHHRHTRARLQPFTSPKANGEWTATVGWARHIGGDAPDSPRRKALHIVTDANPNDSGDASYAGVVPQHIGIRNKLLKNVTALRFDSTTADDTAGAPRLSVKVSDGTWLYLSAYHCNSDLNGKWSRSNFLANDADCTIYDSAGNSYVSDSSSTAWAKVLGKYGDQKLRQVFLVVDEGPKNVFIDDIALGANDKNYLFAGPNNKRALRTRY